MALLLENIWSCREKTWRGETGDKGMKQVLEKLGMSLGSLVIALRQ